MDKARLQKYAELLVKKGLNPDAGQDVIIRCALDQPEFVRMVVAECYRNGAGRVMVDWYDPEVSRLDMLFQSEENLGEVLEFEVATGCRHFCGWILKIPMLWRGSIRAKERGFSSGVSPQ